MNEPNNIDWIISVKEQQFEGKVTGYLVNDSLSVPKAEGNRHYADIKVWLESNTPEPMFTDEEIAEQKAEQAKAEAQQYLNSTDWIVTKIAEIQLEGGDVEALKVKYTTELAERKLMRELI